MTGQPHWGPVALLATRTFPEAQRHLRLVGAWASTGKGKGEDVGDRVLPGWAQCV